MRKIHGGKAVTLSLAGAVTGGIILYGVVRLGLRLAAAPAVKKVTHFIRGIVDHGVGLTGQAPVAETVFQADAAAGQDPGWTPPRAPDVYGPN